MGSFPLSSSGNSLNLVVMDYFTRYFKTKPFLRGTATEVVKFFIENSVFCHGTPKVVEEWGIGKGGEKAVHTEYAR